MRCYKCDGYGEAACEHAKYDPMTNTAQCSHPCVVMAETQRNEMERKLWDAERKLEQYREAVRPIVRNCRAILDALEAESKAANEPKTQRAQSSRGKSAAPQNSGKGGGENDATNGRDIDGDSRWGTLNPARACRLLRRYIFESTCLSLCFRGGAMIVRKIETCPECGREHDLRRRRETHAAAAMREALEHIVNERGILDFCHNNIGSKTWEDWDKVYKVLGEIIEKAMAALAAPPRNCDVMDWRTAWKTWREKFHPETPVGYSAVVKGTEAFMDWFTAPATEQEGGAK